ncbi:Uncharacterized membrane protein [Arachidicoccus rhizosphaerae]|uniref:Uncharacterized membrane protein n=1 Tax=Arachidicoccus rhizosphaerae TaxID=551991 RepID=A0A1H3XCE9_9BACT|nr:DUF1634 domain-containing protein [Arachidicoccus rhizosphaerae]SDZ96910.1 Uncharacterized membrane protein [Arachidicoccus rhizosphaerae]
MSAKTIEDKDISLIIGKILRWGVYLALTVTSIGGLIYLINQHGQTSMQHSVFIENDENLWTLIKLTVHGVLKGDGLSIIELGILLLIATPLTRVIFSLWAFYKEKDRMYVTITILVLFIITISILTGFGG